MKASSRPPQQLLIIGVYICYLFIGCGTAKHSMRQQKVDNTASTVTEESNQTDQTETQGKGSDPVISNPVITDPAPVDPLPDLDPTQISPIPTNNSGKGDNSIICNPADPLCSPVQLPNNPNQYDYTQPIETPVQAPIVNPLPSPVVTPDPVVTPTPDPDQTIIRTPTSGGYVHHANPFNLSFRAYRGAFQDRWGSYAVFCQKWNGGQITRDELVDAAIEEGLSDPDKADSSYGSHVESQMDSTCR